MIILDNLSNASWLFTYVMDPSEPSEWRQVAGDVAKRRWQWLWLWCRRCCRRRDKVVSSTGERGFSRMPPELIRWEMIAALISQTFRATLDEPVRIDYATVCVHLAAVGSGTCCERVGRPHLKSCSHMTFCKNTCILQINLGEYCPSLQCLQSLKTRFGWSKLCLNPIF